MHQGDCVRRVHLRHGLRDVVEPLEEALCKVQCGSLSMRARGQPVGHLAEEIHKLVVQRQHAQGRARLERVVLLVHLRVGRVDGRQQRRVVHEPLYDLLHRADEGSQRRLHVQGDLGLAQPRVLRQQARPRIAGELQDAAAPRARGGREVEVRQRRLGGHVAQPRARGPRGRTADRQAVPSAGHRAAQAQARADARMALRRQERRRLLRRCCRRCCRGRDPCHVEGREA
mmetsp:Transcript_108819/g.318374  ORF Transcript_108819/g.318374 Transcript_108819/m.318374 type:complete len:229 (+) Transcript_108819:2368-3054(+)